MRCATIDGEVRWLLLVYTIPTTPTRLRALIWRRLKELGAIYLRDGVCVLPDQADTRARLRLVANKVREFGGQATLAEHAELNATTVELVREQSQEARQLEYVALADAARSLAAHVAHERRHRDLQPAELRGLASDLGKLPALDPTDRRTRLLRGRWRWASAAGAGRLRSHARGRALA